MLVNALYNRITRDKRHRDATLLSYDEIGQRSFAGWSMGQVNMDRLNAALLLRYSEKATLDPFAVSGVGVARPLQRAGRDGVGDGAGLTFAGAAAGVPCSVTLPGGALSGAVRAASAAALTGG